MKSLVETVRNMYRAQPQSEATMMKDNGEVVHNCARHVEHADWGHGHCLSEQHATPDAAGNIAWYDVMFDHGIERAVPTASLNILVSEAHMHSNKKKQPAMEAMDLSQDVEDEKDKPKGKGKKMVQDDEGMCEDLEQVQEGDPSYYKGKSYTGNALPPPGSFADMKRTGNTLLKGFKSNPQPIKPYVRPEAKNEEVEQIDESAARFIQKVNQAANAAASNNHKNALRHLDNARTFMLGVKSTDMSKINDAYATYKNLRKKYAGSDGNFEPKDQMVGVAKVTKEEEQLDELSKTTLGRYMRRAVPSAQGAMADVQRSQTEGGFRMSMQKLDKRNRGIMRAVDKLAKEDVEQIDELSKDTLKSYVDKAATRLVAGDKYKGMDRYNRVEGIKKATSKLAKEEVEQIDELKSSTLARYIGKSQQVARDSAYHAGVAAMQGKLSDSEHLQTKERKRATGIMRASHKLARRSVGEEVEQIDETLGATLRKYVPGLGKDELKKRYLDADWRTRYTLGKAPENHTDADKKELEMHAKKLRRYGKLVDKHIGEAYDEEVEQLDELSPNTMHNFKAGRREQQRDFKLDPHMSAGEYDDRSKKVVQGIKLANIRLRAQGQSTKTPDYLRHKRVEEEVEQIDNVDETIEYRTRTFTIDEAQTNSYDAHFRAMMKKYGITHPGELETAEKKKAFFNAVDASYKAKNEDVFLEAMMRSDVESNIRGHVKAGNKVTDVVHTTKGGETYHSFVVTQPSGKRTRHIYHGNSQRLETMSPAPKSKLAADTGEDDNDK